MQRHPNNNCFICTKAVYIRPSVLARSKSGHPFCSNECYGKFCRKPIECVVCGTEILAGKNKKTCSHACANKNRTGIKYKKLGRPNKDKVKDLRAIRLRLYEHLGKISCERCNYDKISDVLQVHHVIERCEGGGDELENLELLCPTCHMEEHYHRNAAKKALKK